MRTVLFLLIAVLGMATMQAQQSTPPRPAEVPAGSIYVESFYKEGSYWDIWMDSEGQKYHYCQACQKKTETIYDTRIEYRDRIVYKDREVIKEVPIYVGGGNQNQQADINSMLMYLEAQNRSREIDLLADHLISQKRQGIVKITLGTVVGLAEGTGAILSGVGDYRYGTAAMNGLLQSFFNITNNVNRGGSGGTFTPDDRLPVGVGGGNNNSNLDPFYSNFSGQNGSSGTSFSNNNSQGFIPGDNNAVGGRYVYRRSR